MHQICKEQHAIFEMVITRAVAQKIPQSPLFQALQLQSSQLQAPQLKENSHLLRNLSVGAMVIGATAAATAAILDA